MIAFQLFSIKPAVVRSTNGNEKELSESTRDKTVREMAQCVKRCLEMNQNNLALCRKLCLNEEEEDIFWMIAKIPRGRELTAEKISIGKIHIHGTKPNIAKMPETSSE